MTRKEHGALVKSTEAKLAKLRAKYAAARELDHQGEMVQVEYAGRRLNESLEALRKAGVAMSSVRGW